jgi:hypothetical protein
MMPARGGGEGGEKHNTHDWSDIVEAMDADAPAKKRGPYKKDCCLNRARSTSDSE